MSTIGIESWALDLKDVGAIYPFQGYETPLVIAAGAFWIIWHIWQFAHENEELRHKTRMHNGKNASDAIDRY